MRYFIDHDDSHQWYMVPLTIRAEWQYYVRRGQFLDHNPPSQAIMIQSPDVVTFQDPEYPEYP